MLTKPDSWRRVDFEKCKQHRMETFYRAPPGNLAKKRPGYRQRYWLRFSGSFRDQIVPAFFEPFCQPPSVFPTSLRTIGNAIIPMQCKDTCKRKASIKLLLTLKWKHCTLLHLAYIVHMRHWTWHPHPLPPFQYVRPYGDTSCFAMGFLRCCLMRWTNHNRWQL